MLLLDRANDPRNSVYYIAAQIYNIIATVQKTDGDSLQSDFMQSLSTGALNVETYFLALDFLFLLGKIDIDRTGDIYVS